MKKNVVILLFALLASLAAVFSTPFLSTLDGSLGSAVSAQDEGLKLGLSRDWGYGGFGEIQGTFSMKVSGPADLAKVEFYIDDTKIGEASKAPFNLQFVTDNYPAGPRILSAVGTTTAGSKLSSNKINVNFVSATDSGSKTLKIIIPLLVVVFGGMLLATVFSVITGRKNKNLPAGAPRSYPFGGGICKRCQRPFAFSPLNMNLLTGKLVHCPYCGKWGVLRHASLDQLRAAEQAELEREKGQIPEASPEEKLKKDLDDSRFSGM